MELKQTYWYDNNSEPPKNYIWVKQDGPYMYNFTERKWVKFFDGNDGSSDGLYKDIIQNSKLIKYYDASNDDSPIYDLKPFKVYYPIGVQEEQNLWWDLNFETDSATGFTGDTITLGDILSKNEVRCFKKNDVQTFLDFINTHETSFSMVGTSPNRYNIRQVGMNKSLPTEEIPTTEIQISNSTYLYIHYLAEDEYSIELFINNIA